MDVAVISHTDPDGVCSAAIALRWHYHDKIADDSLLDCIRITEPDYLPKILEELDGFKMVIITDLAVNRIHANRILEIVSRRGLEVIYIDHHPLRLPRGRGIRIYHSTKECATAITFRKFPVRDLERLVVYAAVGDYMDHTPFVRKIIARYDRPTLMFEAGLLNLALSFDNDLDVKRKISLELARGKQPSEIEIVVERGLKEVKNEYRMIEKALERAVDLGPLVYVEMESNTTGAGKIASYLAGYYQKPAICLIPSKKGDFYKISLRKPRGDRRNLGKILEKATMEVGGSGGGHPAAAGGRISMDKKDDLISLLLELLS